MLKACKMQPISFSVSFSISIFTVVSPFLDLMAELCSAYRLPVTAVTARLTASASNEVSSRATSRTKA